MVFEMPGTTLYYLFRLCNDWHESKDQQVNNDHQRQHRYKDTCYYGPDDVSIWCFHGWHRKFLSYGCKWSKKAYETGFNGNIISNIKAVLTLRQTWYQNYVFALYTTRTERKGFTEVKRYCLSYCRP